jgi:hypothetical protein
MTHDTKCYELAEYFLPHDSKREVSYMAQKIQDAIEETLHECRYCHRYFDFEEMDDVERICFDCEQQREDARHDEALGL